MIVHISRYKKMLLRVAFLNHSCGLLIYKWLAFVHWCAPLGHFVCGGSSITGMCRCQDPAQRPSPKTTTESKPRNFCLARLRVDRGA